MPEGETLPAFYFSQVHKDCNDRREKGMPREEIRRRRKIRFYLVVLVLATILAFLIHKQIVYDVFNPIPPDAVFKVDTGEHAVALTFDVVWEPTEVERILDILDRYQVRATFFLAGSWIRKNPDLAREIALRGHELGQHTQNHPRMEELSDEEIAKEFDQMEESMAEELNMQSGLFRPPYGELEERTLAQARERGYKIIVWSINPHDWLDPGIDKIVSRVVTKVHKGAIITLHTSSTQGTEALPMIIQGLKMQGYRILPVGELLELSGR